MLTRREFIQGSFGVALGAVLAGLGLSTSPTLAHAVAGVDDLTLGYVVAAVLAAYGVGVSLNGFVQSGGSDAAATAIGRSFAAFSADAANYNAIVSATNSQVSAVAGSPFDDSAVAAAVADAAWLDGLSGAISDSDAGSSLSCDWLNARTAEVAAFFGAATAWLAGCHYDYPSMSYGSALSFYFGSVASFVASLGVSNFISDAPANASFFIASVNPDGTMNEYSQIYAFDAVPTLFPTRSSFNEATSVIPRACINGDTFNFVGSVGSYDARKNRRYWTGVSSTPSSTVHNFYSKYGVLSEGFSLDASLSSDMLINPARQDILDNPIPIDDFGYGGAVVGNDWGIDNTDGGVSSFGNIALGPDVLGPGISTGDLSKWGDIVWDGGAGVLNPGAVRALDDPFAVPLDTPIDVSIPDVLNPDIAIPRTTTLEQIISDAITTSISKAIDTPIEAVGEPFYPVNPPGTDSKPPSDLPLGDFPFQNVFPFNMLFDWLKWIRDNI